MIYGGGELRQLLSQVIAVLATMSYSFVVTVIILKILDYIPSLGLRVSDKEERAGLDLSQHGERAWGWRDLK